MMLSFTCSSCAGTGEGMYDGSTCGNCKGFGEVKEHVECCSDCDDCEHLSNCDGPNDNDNDDFQPPNEDDEKPFNEGERWEKKHFDYLYNAPDE